MKISLRPGSHALMMALLMLAPCGCDKKQMDESGGQAAAAPRRKAGLKIALLLPESKTARYESHDRPAFQRRVRELCADCEILYSNASQSAAKQQDQAEAALTNGAQVMVLDPV